MIQVRDKIIYIYIYVYYVICILYIIYIYITNDVVERKYSNLLEKFHKYCLEPRCRNIEVFYHVTTVAAKQQIVQDKRLKEAVAHPLQGKPESPIDEMKIQGVYFTLNLDKKNDKLPTTSPYGTERVSIPISNFSGYELFFNSYHHNFVFGTLIYYVILVMVKPSHSDYDIIAKVLKKLNPSNNDILLLNSPYRYYDYYKLKDGKSFNAYFEVFVVGGVPVGSDAVWDTVKDTGRPQ